MTTPTPSPGHPISQWKRLAIVSLFGGVGFAVALATIIGAVVWNNSRRKPSEPWNTNAIVADDSPRFDPGADAKKVVFRYSLNNTTDIDYHIDSNDTYKLMVKTKDGIFTAPMARETASVTLPVFIPAKQKSFFKVSLAMNLPPRSAGESDDEYHSGLGHSLKPSEIWQALLCLTKQTATR